MCSKSANLGPARESSTGFSPSRGRRLGAFSGEDGISEVRDHPAPVISSGGNMLHENTVKIATASRSREIFLGRGNTGLFNAFHLSRFAANAPPQPSAAPPMGEPSFNGVVWTLIFFTQISILSFYTGTPPPQAVPLPSKEGRLGAFCGEAAGTQLSTLKSQLSTLSFQCSHRFVCSLSIE